MYSITRKLRFDHIFGYIAIQKYNKLPVALTRVATMKRRRFAESLRMAVQLARNSWL